jgi:5'-3' exonuclease
MGVKLGNIIQGTHLIKADLSKKSVAIDASYTIMVFLNRRYGPNPEIPVDKTMRAINHLYGILYRTISLIECGILPVFCFDGIPDELKRLSTKNRFNDFERTKERYEQCLKMGDKSLAKKIALGKEFLWMNCIREVRMLLKALGIPFIDSPSEAEAQCAQLVKMGVCDYCNTSDFDALLLGSPNILKIERVQSRKVTGILYNTQDIFNQLKINRFQLIDLAIMIGNDFFPGVHGIGIKMGLELVQKYGTLEQIIARNDKMGPIIANAIEKGKIVGLLGINGAGKTTTIKMLTSLLSPSGGTYHLDELDGIRYPNEVKKRINMIAGGERMIYWRLTAYENLWYYGQIYNVENSILKTRIEELLKLVGLKEKQNVPVETFSKGMKQRLQIARGLIK